MNESDDCNFIFNSKYILIIFNLFCIETFQIFLPRTNIIQLFFLCPLCFHCLYNISKCFISNLLFFSQFSQHKFISYIDFICLHIWELSWDVALFVFIIFILKIILTSFYIFKIIWIFKVIKPFMHAVQIIVIEFFLLFNQILCVLVEFWYFGILIHKTFKFEIFRQISIIFWSGSCSWLCLFMSFLFYFFSFPPINWNHCWL